MGKMSIFFVLPALFVASLILIGPAAVDVARAQSSTIIEAQEMDIPGVAAELIQCKRKGDILTVKVRVANTSSKTVRLSWYDAKKNVYLLDEANGKKYFLLKDATGEYIYSGDPWDISANASKISWFKFPAPPSELEEISIVLPGCAPFEDVPIEDK